MKVLGMNKKETALVVILLLLLVGFGIYKLVYQPLVTKMADLNQELTQVSGERESAEVKIAALPRLEEEISTAEGLAIKEAPPFFSEINQENMILLLKQLADNTSFKVLNYTFNEPTAAKIPLLSSTATRVGVALRELVDNYILKYGTEEQKAEMLSKLNKTTDSGEEAETEEAAVENAEGAATTAAEKESMANEALEGTDEGVARESGENTETAELEYDSLEKKTVVLNFTSTYFQLVSYLHAIEEYGKKIIVSSIAIGGVEGADLVGTMTLDFYLLPKMFLDQTDIRDTEWDLVIPSGKDNPFDYSAQSSEGAVASGRAGESASEFTANEASYSNTDFFLIARSSTADMPTLTVGKGGDSAGASYIRETFTGSKDITFEFSEESGRYYYSYKTDTKVYPESGKQEFTPRRAGIVNLVIYSRRRTSDRDTNNFNITVRNNTSLRLNTEVEDDDRERPRINMR